MQDISAGHRVEPRWRHGHAGTHSGRKATRTYKAWQHMKDRCLNPNDGNYHYYGGRGITITPRWMDFVNFLADMGEVPEGLTLERINNDGNYEPGNCKWVTWAEQSTNKRIKGHCPYGHPYSEENTYRPPRGGRRCRICIGNKRAREKLKFSQLHEGLQRSE